MGSRALRRRDKWQDASGAKAATAEYDFYSVFTEHFKDREFRIRPKPKEFQNIYVDVKLAPNVVAEIYTPYEPVKRHGLSPDYAIDNVETKKTIYVEVKRQDGWVEGGKRADGRGNAHERSCKYFTPGLLEMLRRKANLADNVLPFWTVFQGDITRDPCRVREITLWYKGHENHFFFWRNSKDKRALLDHFNRKIKVLLE
jgi:hypothetical protein